MNDKVTVLAKKFVLFLLLHLLLQLSFLLLAGAMEESCLPNLGALGCAKEMHRQRQKTNVARPQDDKLTDMNH